MKKGNGDPPSPFLFLIPGPASARRSFELRFLLGHRLAARVVGRLDDRLLLLDEGLHLLLQVAGPTLGLLPVVLRKAGDPLSGLLSGDGCVEQGQPRADQPPGQERKEYPTAAVATPFLTHGCPPFERIGSRHATQRPSSLPARRPRFQDRERRRTAGPQSPRPASSGLSGPLPSRARRWRRPSRRAGGWPAPPRWTSGGLRQSSRPAGSPRSRDGPGGRSACGAARG